LDVGNKAWVHDEGKTNRFSCVQEKFPEFIQGLENKHKDGMLAGFMVYIYLSLLHHFVHIADLYHATDFYPKDIASAKIQEIKEWLRAVHVREFERVPLDSEQLDKVCFVNFEFS
jgi:hypothetical protein